MPLKWPGEYKTPRATQIPSEPLLVKRTPWLELLFDGDHDSVKLCLGVAAMACGDIVTAAAWDTLFQRELKRISGSLALCSPL